MNPLETCKIFMYCGIYKQSAKIIIRLLQISVAKIILKAGIVKIVFNKIP